MNALSHGVLGRKPILLPGERLDEYRKMLADWLLALNPSSDAEIEVVARIADLAWRQRRLDLVEQRHLEEQVVEEVRQSPEAKAVETTRHILEGLRALLSTAESTNG